MRKITFKQFFALSLALLIGLSLHSCSKTAEQGDQPAQETTLASRDSSQLNDPKVVYFSGVTSQKLLMDDAFYVLNNLMRNPSPQDDFWTFQLNVQLTRIQRMLLDEFGQICPVEYQEANIHYLQALESFRFVAENYSKAVNDLDMTLMEACNEQLAIGTDLLGSAVSELNRQQP
jgi:hypothetical protein